MHPLLCTHSSENIFLFFPSTSVAPLATLLFLIHPCLCSMFSTQQSRGKASRPITSTCSGFSSGFPFQSREPTPSALCNLVPAHLSNFFFHSLPFTNSTLTTLALFSVPPTHAAASPQGLHWPCPEPPPRYSQGGIPHLTQVCTDVTPPGPPLATCQESSLPSPWTTLRRGVLYCNPHGGLPLPLHCCVLPAQNSTWQIAGTQ
uniref:Uncharacterized protein n=1 Tax=Molossus molossus TaxID=27622 RepID=A0A7J8FRQ9_MOLMO|nr:hypothetical protein HJG59_008341 [Molossus molossus]